MSQWSKRRKTTIIGAVLFVLVLFVVGAVVKKINVPPTCFDGKQNGEEQGIDCGGECALVCSPASVPLVVQWERVLKVTDGVYHAVAYVQNQNKDAGSPDVHYRFRAYDERNVIVADREGRISIGPQQTIAVFEPSLQTGNRIATRVFFEILSPIVWVKVDERWQRTGLVIENRNLSGQETRPRLTANVRNQLLYPLYDIELTALLYDQAGNVLAVSQTQLRKINAQSSESITFTWPESFSGVPVRIDILPRINIFARENQ